MPLMLIDLVKPKLSSLKKATRSYLNNAYHYEKDISWSTYWQFYSRHSQRLLRFKNIHKGKGCFIIGNGPSLNLMDLSALQDYHTFGLNKIYLIFERVKLNLSYHISVQPLVIQQSIKEFESLQCPSFLSYNNAKNIVKDCSNIYFILTGGLNKFQSDLTLQIPTGYTVTYVAMQIAYYMGFQQVFLIGVDHNFPTALGKANENQFLAGQDANHFDPRYFANQQWQLPDLEGSELSYYTARYQFNKAGRQIYDATVDGKLQVFPKISFEQALKMCSKK